MTRRGRPPGRTAQGDAARDHLYDVAIGQITEHGYEATTLREIARVAGVSPGLLYRYFPSKAAVVLALYDALSTEYAARAERMPAGAWADRARFALETSLAVLGPHRRALGALVPVLVSGAQDSVFGERTAFSRRRVQPVFVEAVVGADNAPDGALAAPLGRLLYLAHLAVLLWWVLDSSVDQRATVGLLALGQRVLPLAGLVLLLPGATDLVVTADALARDALLGELDSGRTT